MGTRKNRLAKAVLTNTHNLCFEQKYEKNYEKKLSDFFLSEKFQFLELKFSIYLNRRVFVMHKASTFCWKASVSTFIECETRPTVVHSYLQ